TTVHGAGVPSVRRAARVTTPAARAASCRDRRTITVLVSRTASAPPRAARHAPRAAIRASRRSEERLRLPNCAPPPGERLAHGRLGDTLQLCDAFLGVAVQRAEQHPPLAVVECIDEAVSCNEERIHRVRYGPDSPLRADVSG